MYFLAILDLYAKSDHFLLSVLWGKALNSNPDEDRAPLDDPVIDLDVAPFERINKRLQIILGILQYAFEKHANYRKRIIGNVD